MQVYRVRPSVAAGLTLSGVPFLLVTALALVQLPRVSWVDLAPVLVFVVWFLRTRRQTLTVSDEGMVVQRPSYRLMAAWSDVIEVRQRPGMVAKVDELVLRDARTESVDDRGKTGRLPRTMTEDDIALRRIRVSNFDKHWRDGPIGDHLRASLPDL